MVGTGLRQPGAAPPLRLFFQRVSSNMRQSLVSARINAAIAAVFIALPLLSPSTTLTARRLLVIMFIELLTWMGSIIVNKSVLVILSPVVLAQLLLQRAPQRGTMEQFDMLIVVVTSTGLVEC